MVNIVWLVVFLAQCDPISGLWDPREHAGCWDRNIEVVVDYVQGGMLHLLLGKRRVADYSAGFAILTDLILSLAPIGLLWNVQMALRRKLLICGLMSAGIL